MNIYELEKILHNRKKEILNFFETKDNGMFNFNVKVYNEKNLNSDLSFKINKDNSINFYIKDDFLNKKENIFIEEVRCIEYLIYGMHPKWLSIGIALCIDNKIDIKNIIEDSNINEFTYPYDSYIIVSYLIEKYNKSIFIRLIGLKNFIDSLNKQELIVEAIKYYILKYDIKFKRKQKH